MTISSCFSSVRHFRKSAGSLPVPDSTSANMAAARAGVSTSLGAAASSPTPSRINATPFLIFSRSMLFMHRSQGHLHGLLDRDAQVRAQATDIGELGLGGHGAAHPG